MKKIILCAAMVLQGVIVNAQSYLEIFPDTKPIIAASLKSLKPSETTKAKWVNSNDKIRVSLETFEESEWLYVNVNPKMSKNTNVEEFQKVFLNIYHKINLNKNVYAEIEAVLDKKTSIAFVPITDVILKETQNAITGQNLKKAFQRNYPALVKLYPPVVFSEDNKEDCKYNSIYPIHIAGTNDIKNDSPKLSISDVSKIKSFRFRLRKINSKSPGTNSIWEIKKINSNYLLLDKIKKNPNQNIDKAAPIQPKINKKVRMPIQEQSSTAENSDADDEIVGSGGTCPLPHGH